MLGEAHHPSGWLNPNAEAPFSWVLLAKAMQSHRLAVDPPWPGAYLPEKLGNGTGMSVR